VTDQICALIAGGFVPKSKKKVWTPPRIRQFKDGGEALEYFKSRGSGEKLGRLRAMLDDHSLS
jgi:hypothetical protein